MTMLTRITGLLSGAAAVAAFAALRFARPIAWRMFEHAATEGALPRPTVIALRVADGTVAIPLLVVSLAGVLAAEIFVKTPGTRLLVQLTVLLLTVSALAIALAGLFMPYHIPVVNIP